MTSPTHPMVPLKISCVIFLPSFVLSIIDACHKSNDVLWGQHLKTVAESAHWRFIQRALTLVCLPYEAFFSLDAIARTAVRMLITHKRLLEWNLSSDTNRDRTDLIGSFRTMWIAPFTAIVAFFYLSEVHPLSLAAAGPVVGSRV